MITPEMSRALGRLMAAVDQVMADEGLPQLSDAPDNSDSERLVSYSHFIFQIYQHWQTIECDNEEELDAQEAEIYNQIRSYPDQEIVEKVFAKMKNWRNWLDWLGEEEQELLHLND